MKKVILTILMSILVVPLALAQVIQPTLPLDVAPIPPDVAVFAAKNFNSEVWRYNINSDERSVQKDLVHQSYKQPGFGVGCMDTASNNNNDVSIVLTENILTGRFVRLIEIPKNNLAAKKVTNLNVNIAAWENFHNCKIVYGQNSRFILFYIVDMTNPKDPNFRIVVKEFIDKNNIKTKEIVKGIKSPFYNRGIDLGLLRAYTGQILKVQVTYPETIQVNNKPVEMVSQIDVDVTNSSWPILPKIQHKQADLTYQTSIKNGMVTYGYTEFSPFKQKVVFRFLGTPAIEVGDGFGSSLSNTGVFSIVARLDNNRLKAKKFLVRTPKAEYDLGIVGRGSTLKKTAINKQIVGAKINQMRTDTCFVAVSSFGRNMIEHLDLHILKNGRVEPFLEVQNINVIVELGFTDINVESLL